MGLQQLFALLLTTVLLMISTTLNTLSKLSVKVGSDEKYPYIVERSQKDSEFVFTVIDDARVPVPTVITNTSQPKPAYFPGRVRYVAPSSNRQIMSLMKFGRPADKGRLITLLLKHRYNSGLEKLAYWTDDRIYSSMPPIEDNKKMIAERARHQGEEIAHQLVLRTGVKFQPGAKMMDIGCGDGTITNVISRRLGITDVSCVEVLDPPEGTIKYHKPGEYKSPNSIDLVIALFSMHHIPELNAMVDSIYDMLKPGGYLLIKEHDCWNAADAIIVDVEHSIFIAGKQRALGEKIQLDDAHTLWFKNYMAWDNVFSKFTYVWADYYEASGRVDITPSRGYLCIYKKPDQ